jgi:hypothetical protein
MMAAPREPPYTTRGTIVLDRNEEPIASACDEATANFIVAALNRLCIAEAKRVVARIFNRP